MKSLVVFISLCSLVIVKAHSLEEIVRELRSHQTQYGDTHYPSYRVQVHNLTTNDGYILKMIDFHRLVYSHGSTQGYRPLKHERNGNTRAVVLVHGYMSSLEDFLYGGEEQGLALNLADSGYHVFLATIRGSRYAREHTRLNANRDQSFWDFSWHEVGTIDMPRIVDEALEISGEDKVKIVAHTEGATSTLILGSENPKYNQKISQIITLNPVVFLKQSQNKVINKIAKNLDQKAWISKNVGISVFAPRRDVTMDASIDCIDQQQKIQEICDNDYFLVKGYNGSHMNKTLILNQVLNDVPSLSAVNQILNVALWKKFGIFQRYYETPGLIHKYDLSKITTKVTILHTVRDQTSGVEDFAALANELDQAQVERIELPGLDNSVEILFGNNVRDKINKVVIENM